MGCSKTLYGIAQECNANVGGIKKAYIANFQEGIFKYTVATGSTEGDIEIPNQITGITSGVTFLPVEFRKGSSSMTSTLNTDQATGLNYVSTEVALAFARQETGKRLAVASMALGGIAMVVVDANNEWHGLGVDEGMFPTAGGAETGTARGDANQYTLTLGDEFRTFPMMLTEDAKAAVKAAAGE